MPEEIVWRQPFPGPGLAIRIIGEVTEDRLTILRQADLIAREELRNAGQDHQVSGNAQLFFWPMFVAWVSKEMVEPMAIPLSCGQSLAKMP